MIPTSNKGKNSQKSTGQYSVIGALLLKLRSIAWLLIAGTYQNCPVLFAFAVVCERV
jgi:hypothetical protein